MSEEKFNPGEYVRDKVNLLLDTLIENDDQRDSLLSFFVGIEFGRTMCRAIEKTMEEFGGYAPFPDDVKLVVLEIINKYKEIENVIKKTGKICMTDNIKETVN